MKPAIIFAAFVRDTQPQLARVGLGTAARSTLILQKPRVSIGKSFYSRIAGSDVKIFGGGDGDGSHSSAENCPTCHPEHGSSSSGNEAAISAKSAKGVVKSRSSTGTTGDSSGAASKTRKRRSTAATSKSSSTSSSPKSTSSGGSSRKQAIAVDQHLVSRTEKAKRTAELRKPALLRAEHQKLAISPWQLYIHQMKDKVHISIPDRTGGYTNMADLARSYAQLSNREKSALQHQAEQNRKDNDSRLMREIQSMTVQQVWQENLSRKRWNRAGKKPRVSLLEDKRVPNRPKSGYQMFLAELRARHENTHLTPSEFLRRGSQLWQSLSDGQKSQYQKVATSAAQEYKRARDALSL